MVYQNLESYVTLSDVLKYFKVNKSDVINLIKKFPVLESLILLSNIDILLTNRGISDYSVQSEIIDLVFPPERCNFLKHLIKSGRFKVVFHHQQIYLCSNLILKEGNLEFKKVNKEFYYSMGLVLLLINDVYKINKNKHYLNENELKVHFWHNENFSSVFFREIAIEISRSYKVYFKKLKQKKIDELFQDTFQSDLKTFWSIFAGLYAYWGIDNFPNDLRNIILNIDKVFQYCHGINIKQIKNILEFLSSEIIDLRKSIELKYNQFQNISFNFMSLFEKPLLKINQKEFLCLSLPYLSFYATRGILEFLRINMASLDYQKKLGDIIGKLYQDYVIEKFNDIYLGSGRLHTGYSKRKEIGDLVIDYGDELIFIEVKSTLIQKRFKLSNNLEDIENALSGYLNKKGFIQIHKNIERFRTGDIKIKNLSPKIIKKYWPVIISCIEDIPENYFLIKHYNSILKKYNILNGIDVSSLTILNLTEFDYIIELIKKGNCFLDLIKNIIRNKKYPLGIYIKILANEKNIEFPSHLNKYYAEWSKDVFNTLKLSK